jgi:hypothetical protein
VGAFARIVEPDLPSWRKGQLFSLWECTGNAGKEGGGETA